MSWIKTLAVALLAEAAGYFLSLSWGFLLLIAAFVVTGLRQQATSAKAADTENRVNELVPAVNSIKDTADYASGRADDAYSNANGRVSRSGDHITGTLQIDGDLTCWASCGIHGNCNIVGDINSSYHIPQPSPSTESGPPTGGSGGISGDATSHYCGAFYSGSGAASWASTITNQVNAIVGTLRNMGIVT